MIAAKCPLRISLAGGSTDLQSFIDKYGRGAVINFTPNLYTYATINRDVLGLSSLHSKYIVNYSLREECGKSEEIKNDIVRECFKYFNIGPNTSSLTADIFSSGSGLASSSSYLISFIKAIVHRKELKITNEKICEIALELERKFNPLTGYQDPYGCGIGGLKRIDIEKPNKVKITPLSTKIFSNLDMHLVYTGATRSSTDLLKSVKTKKSLGLLTLVDEMEKCITEEDTPFFLETIQEGWERKKHACPEMTQNPTVKALDESLENSPKVLAHRLCGAGNGGFFLLFTSPDWNPSENNLEKHIIPINISSYGAQARKI
jgi:D-glycero-alpha-D-manno-heptose-7-phosphate kinase